jgi:integrase
MAQSVGQPIKDLRGYMPEEQIRKLLVGAHKLRDKLLLRLLWVTGCRISELLGGNSWYPINCSYRKEKKCLTTCYKNCEHRITQKLRVFEPAHVNDIDWNDGVIILNLLKRKKYPPPQHRVALDKITLNMLKEYIKQEHLQPTDPIFNITRQRAFQITREIGKSVGINKVGSKGLHDHHFRHSHCVAYVKKNNTLEGLRKLQKRIGHASISTTAEYLQFGPEAKEETEDIFGKF